MLLSAMCIHYYLYAWAGQIDRLVLEFLSINRTIPY